MSIILLIHICKDINYEVKTLKISLFVPHTVFAHAKSRKTLIYNHLTYINIYIY